MLLLAAGAEQQHRRAVAGALRVHRARRAIALPSPPAPTPVRARDAVRIEDHDHRAVAQDGVAAEHRDVAQDRRHRLDHDFLGVEHPVDDDAQHVGADLGHDDIGAAVVAVRSSPSASRSFRLTSGSSRSRSRSTGVSLIRSMTLSAGRRRGALSPRFCARTSSTTLICGMAKRSVAGFDDQRRDDRQRQRDLDDEGGALAGDALQVDGAADLLDVGLHHVHADAAARHGGDHWRRWRSRRGR